MDRDHNSYRFGPFCLDARERVLLRDGRVVPLTGKALTTLLILVRNNGHLVKKSALMDQLWPEEFVEEGNLTQQIFILRRAMGAPDENSRYIETIPRRGYRFVGKLEETAHDKRLDSLAILPFSNVNNDPSMEYLSDGITESIMTSLSHLPQLKVMARSTVFRYKGVAVDPQEVGQMLGVRAVMMGRVQQLGEDLVVSAELVDVEDGSLIWGDQYHRKSSDLFSVPAELAREISEKLRLKLSGEQKDRMTRNSPQNREAYEFYLRGRYSWSKRTEADLRRGIEYFRQAIARDPDYSLAHAGLADCFLLTDSQLPLLVMPEAKAAAMKAIQLDESLGEAYASLGQIKFFYDWDWQEAERCFQQAVRLSPTYPTAHQWYGEYLVIMGEIDRGLAALKKARDLDPLSLIINTDLGFNLYMARQSDLAIEQLKGVIELEPSFFRAHLYLGVVYAHKSMFSEAVAELEMARRLNENQYTLAGLGHVYASFGEKAEAEKLLARLLELSRERYVSPVLLGVIHAGFRDHVSEAMECLTMAYEQRARILVWLKACPIFDGLRADPAFVDLLGRIGF